jgi:hypothetical protein
LAGDSVGGVDLCACRDYDDFNKILADLLRRLGGERG